MFRGIFGLVPSHEDTDQDLRTRVHQDRGLVVDETQEYLDGARIQAGDAATTVSRETKQASLAGDEIIVEQAPTTETLHTEWVADVPGAGFAAVDSGDGEFVFGLIREQTGVPVYRAQLDVSAIAGHFDAEFDADWWQVGWGNDEEAGVAYHNTNWVQDPTRSEATQLGFVFHGDHGPTRGTLAESGYLALFSPELQPAQLGRWLRDHILPYATLDLDSETDDEAEQETLDGEEVSA